MKHAFYTGTRSIYGDMEAAAKPKQHRRYYERRGHR